MRRRVRAFAGFDDAVRLSAVTAGVTAGVYWVLHRSLIDDAYITLVYARNVAFHFHWGLIPQRTANSVTSPLNVLAIATISSAVRNPLLALGVLYVAANTAFAWFTARTARVVGVHVGWAATAVAVVVFNPFTVSTVGMETTTLGVALLGALLFYAVGARPLAFGVAAGLAVVTRLDLAVFAVVLVASSRALRRRVASIIAAAALVSGPWFIFSWLALGSAIPDTYVLKTTQHWDYSFLEGPLFYDPRGGVAVWLALVPAAFGVVIIALWAQQRFLSRTMSRDLDPVAALGIGGLVYFAIYVAVSPPPYLWYYNPVLHALSTAGVLLVPGLARSTTPRRAHQLARATAAGFLVLAISFAAIDVGHDEVPSREPVIIGNVVPSSEYERIARMLRARVGDQAVISPVEVGALTYYCQCTVVDYFGDRGWVVPLIEETIGSASAPKRWLLEDNYRNLDRDVLPIVPAYQLDVVGRQHGHRKPGVWSARSRFTGVVDFLLVRRRMPDRRAIARLAARTVPRLPAGRGPVVVEDGPGATFADSVALVEELRRRHVAANLGTSQRPRMMLEVTNGARLGAVLATHRARLVASSGDAATRETLERRAVALRDRYEAGSASAQAYYIAAARVVRYLRDTSAVVTGDTAFPVIDFRKHA